MASTSDLKSTNSDKKRSSMSETGHNKNGANFSAAYQILEEMGAIYNPSNSNLFLANLQPKKVSLGEIITVLNDKKPIYKNAVADREVAIAPLGKRMSKALNYSKSINISDTDKENIASQVKKIRGDKKAKTVNPDTAEVETISTSQMSYDSRIANLETITSQFASHPEYAPNETEIQVPTLQAYHTELTTLSSLVNSAGNALITARKNRNQILYFDDQNIIQLIKDIKNYVKSLGDVAKPYYKALVKLKFSDIKK
ncbi:hypothetical protein SL053_002021 [Flavobacterium psychrophilum]|uniref:Uncharacterized protein n=1 Tax=Flavobacterium psychrophilum (strain ATCC 49511 / DSM 21280 / CIP 103535 / JIP02/86) TaxID=402612 RepID=A6H0R8_FLAPJ|nr:hypothetical protein [Flavobacterium psychrophilum]AIG30626.1 hypothetical protein IA03_09160 [Flavobacterium psychrophilum]AIG32901.1 hypothetical protein IA01_09190 [Flavobacterium psychrophilum]AIG35056.1 hypothetical protein IA02_08575 [Flavobacterium psychrophilum]AIG37421.1 hypothetical protein IA04_09095 [Flavobacterium psychrophilum]AIG39685.1 hypothetical protein IA05_09170 [Flavobacterium psychrophilum]